ncbi:hypothetical protein ASAP_2911 [Asaia bogorensis]|uniref:Uncharacterized protein n=1 Tax=Asaia bogorensis TaxID=91915 RepID=A0A060QLQ1_9PROT|nr:hypothetical protein ASAP_2911 [Asaia bogorensis]
MCAIVRLALGAIPGSGRQAVPGAVLAFEIIVAGWAALHGYHATFGPLALDPLISCWIILWGLTQLAPDKACGPIGEASGALGLLCHNQALALICFIPCLIENRRLGPRASGLAWQLAFLAPAGCYLAAYGFFPVQGLADSLMSTDIDPTMAGHVGGPAGEVTITLAVRDFASLGALSGEVFLPLAALATLPAFSAMPVLSWATRLSYQPCSPRPVASGRSTSYCWAAASACFCHCGELWLTGHSCCSA